MNTLTNQHTIATSHGSLSVEENGKDGIPVLFIHGNSFCKEVFRPLLHGKLAEKHRFITFDLPGHGQSSDALDPISTYTVPGFADSAIELLERMGISEAIVYGWSLGGHIGIEMLSRFQGMRGLMISGTPPVGIDNMAQGFSSPPNKGAASKEHFTMTEAEAFARAVFGESAQPFLVDAVMRADGRFRHRMFEALRAGAGIDQRLMVETSPIPLAIVNGSEDHIVNLDYFDTVNYSNLWERKCERLSIAGHVPFWQAQTGFESILERFIKDIDSGKASAQNMK